MDIKATIPAPRTLQQLRAMDSFNRSQFPEAIVLFQKALEITKNAECWNGLGCSQFALNRFADAESSFRRALELDGGYALAAQNLGALLIGQKQTAEALAVLTRAHKTLASQDQSVIAPLIDYCLKETRALTLPAVDAATRPTKTLCLVAGFLQNGFSEANAREAWTLFESLRDSSRQGVHEGARENEREVTFASIETNIAARFYDAERQIHAVPPGEVAAFVRELSPDILQVHFPQLSFPVAYGVQHQATTLTLTDSDPLKGCLPEALDEVRHLIDFGRLTLVCQSAATAAHLRANGIRTGAMIPPVMAAPPHGAGNAGPSAAPGTAPQAKEDAAFVVGFATAPYFAEHWETRGIHLLLDLAAESPETQFLLAWRSSPDEIQKAVAARKLANVTVLPGIIDMEAFYDRTDAIILPFAAGWGNHNCPLSAVEGMLRGKPVLATEFVGIADWLRQEQAGIVVPPSVSELRTGLLRLKNDLPNFSKRAQSSSNSRFNRDAAVAAYRQLHRRAMRKEKGPTLQDWENRLEAAGKTLVRGRPALAKFYEERQVAQGYIKERFTVLPFKQFEEEEREAISQSIAAQFAGRRDLQLLDLATGPGRLLSCLTPFGAATALDGSEAMLELARAQNPGVAFVRGDAFDQPLAQKFHVVTCGRLLRHLEYPDRQIFYRRFHDLLREDGIAIVEAPNPWPEYQTRDQVGWETYQVYDVFWTVDDFREELAENGFRLVSAVPVGTNLSPQSSSDPTHPAEPIEHIVSFTKA